MFLQRTAFAAARRAAARPIAVRSFTTSFVRSTSSHRPQNPPKQLPSIILTGRIGEAPEGGKLKKFEGTIYY